MVSAPVADPEAAADTKPAGEEEEAHQKTMTASICTLFFSLPGLVGT
jgi:hypothetical protein